MALKKPTKIKELPVLTFKSQKEWQQWLARNHKASGGIWLRMFKKDSGEKSVNHAEALDVALCYGWIDALAKSYDQNSWIQKFCPRGPKSMWSKINTEHVERLIKSRKMRAAGLKAIEAAKADGRWQRA